MKDENKIQNTFLAHSGAETLSESTVATLITLVLVDGAVALKATRVDVVLAHRTTKEAFAAIARRRAVVFASSTVQTDGTVWTDASCSSRRVTDTDIARRYYRGVHNRRTTEFTANHRLTRVRSMYVRYACRHKTHVRCFCTK